MRILGIETSCDETSAAVVEDGRVVLSCVTNSQVDLHSPYGGVVPEIASRSHVEYLPQVVEEAVLKAGCGYGGLDAVAVTYGPGLASSLLVGLSGAKALALRLDVPLVGINHLEAHLYSVFLAEHAPGVAESLPLLALVVSGGHSCLIRMEALGEYRLLGTTIDDAAGEAFDKGATLLGLGYPGGPIMDRMAKEGRRDAVRFPRGRVKEGNPAVGKLDARLCFSFSGLKTALRYYLDENPITDRGPSVESVTASYQEAVVDALVDRCDDALCDEIYLAAGGGVSLNSRLRERLEQLAADRGVGLLLAPPRYCGDNAAMIAALAGAGRGVRGAVAFDLDVEPSLPVVEP